MRPYKKLSLALAGSFHPRLDGGGGFPQTTVAELVVFYMRHLDVDVNAVEQRSRDALLVLGDGACLASAGLERVAIAAAGADVQFSITAGSR